MGDLLERVPAAGTAGASTVAIRPPGSHQGQSLVPGRGGRPRWTRDRAVSSTDAARGAGAARSVCSETRWGRPVRSYIVPGGVVPDYALPDETGTVRTL